ncbi:hypothetical protein HDU96_001588, partial [Phlyctochytrium bullatum]
PDILQRQFNLTPELDGVLRKAFALDPAKRLSLADFKRQVLSVSRFVKIPNHQPHSLAQPPLPPPREAAPPGNTIPEQNVASAVPKDSAFFTNAPLGKPLVEFGKAPALPEFPSPYTIQQVEASLGNPFARRSPPIEQGTLQQQTQQLQKPSTPFIKELSNLDIVVDSHAVISEKDRAKAAASATMAFGGPFGQSEGERTAASLPQDPFSTADQIDEPALPPLPLPATSPSPPRKAALSTHDSPARSLGEGVGESDALIGPTDETSGDTGSSDATESAAKAAYDQSLSMAWPQPSRETPLVPGTLALGREGIGRLGISRLTHSRTGAAAGPGHRQGRRRPPSGGTSNAFSVAAAALHPLANAIAGWSVWAGGWAGFAGSLLDGSNEGTAPLMPGGFADGGGQKVDASAPLLPVSDAWGGLGGGVVGPAGGGAGVSALGEGIGFDAREADQLGDYDYGTDDESSEEEDRVPDEEDPYESVRHDRRRVPDLETGPTQSARVLGLRRIAPRPVPAQAGPAYRKSANNNNTESPMADFSTRTGKFAQIKDEPGPPSPSSMARPEAPSSGDANASGSTWHGRFAQPHTAVESYNKLSGQPASDPFLEAKSPDFLPATTTTSPNVGTGAGAVAFKNIKLSAKDAGAVSVDRGWEGNGANVLGKDTLPGAPATPRANGGIGYDRVPLSTPHQHSVRHPGVDEMVDAAAAAVTAAVAQVVAMDQKNEQVEMSQENLTFSSLPLSSTAGILFVPKSKTPIPFPSGSITSSSDSASSDSASMPSPEVRSSGLPVLGGRGSPIRDYTAGVQEDYRHQRYNQPNTTGVSRDRTTYGTSSASEQQSASASSSPLRAFLTKDRSPAPSGDDVEQRERPNRMERSGRSNVSGSDPSPTRPVSSRNRRGFQSDEALNYPSIKEVEALSTISASESSVGGTTSVSATSASALQTHSLNNVAPSGATVSSPKSADPLEDEDYGLGGAGSAIRSLGSTLGLRGGFAQIYDSLGRLVGSRRKVRKKNHGEMEGGSNADLDESSDDEATDGSTMPKDVEGGRRKASVPPVALSAKEEESKPHPHRHRNKDLPPRKFSISAPAGETLLPPPPVSIAVVAAAIPLSETDRNNADFEKLILASQRQHLQNQSLVDEGTLSPDRKATTQPSSRGRHRYRRHADTDRRVDTPHGAEELKELPRTTVALKDEDDDTDSRRLKSGNRVSASKMRGFLKNLGRRKSVDFAETIKALDGPTTPKEYTQSSASVSAVLPSHVGSSRRPSYHAAEEAYFINRANPSLNRLASQLPGVGEDDITAALPLFHTAPLDSPQRALPKNPPPQISHNGKDVRESETLLPLHGETGMFDNVRDTLPGHFPSPSTTTVPGHFPTSRSFPSVDLGYPSLSVVSIESPEVNPNLFREHRSLSRPARGVASDDNVAIKVPVAFATLPRAVTPAKMGLSIDIDSGGSLQTSRTEHRHIDGDYEFIRESEARQDHSDDMDGDGVMVGRGSPPKGSESLLMNSTISAGTGNGRGSPHRFAGRDEDGDEFFDDDPEDEVFGEDGYGQFPRSKSFRRYPTKSSTSAGGGEDGNGSVRSLPIGGSGPRTLVRGAYEALRDFMGSSGKRG